MAIAPTTEAPASQSIESFIDDQYSRLVGLLTLRTGSRSLAEDLAQESLLKLVQNWDEVRLMANPWAWLARVAINQSTSRWRRLKVAERVNLKLSASPVTAPSQDGLVDLLHSLDQLPRRQRTALLLRHYIQLSVSETAEAMGCAEGTVKSLTHQARSTMRKLLEEESNE